MKRIGAFGLTILWLATFCFLAVMMVGHFRHIATPDDKLDEKIAMLHEVKALLPPDVPLSFATNLADDESSQGAYYQTQFAWCPRILSNDVGMNDHILFYRATAARDSDMALLHHCDTLYQHPGDGYTLFVLRKTKSK